MQNLVFKGLNGQFKIMAATQYITRIKDSTNESSINSDHAMYAYNFTDPEGNNRSGYYDDGEWKGSTVLSSILEDRKLSDVILIVTRKFGGVFLGKKRFQLIKKAAAEVVNLYTP